jgi:hypothetical protein
MPVLCIFAYMFMHKIRNKTHHLNKLEFIKKKVTKGKTTTLPTTFIWG